MSDAIQQIAQQWRDRASELATWTLTHLVNRSDVWGRYVHTRKTEENPRVKYRAVTAPFRDQRGKVFLGETSLEKHFRARDGRGVLGVHSTSADLSSRWFAIDIDRHDETDLAITPESNFAAAHTWWERLLRLGFDPLLLDSNGVGGYHLLVLLGQPVETKSLHRFVKQFVQDAAQVGLDALPETFPGDTRWDHLGDWLRLPGRHHYRRHYTRLWNDEPYAETKWLVGHDAIDRLIATRPATRATIEQQGIAIARRTVCLDFDGVIHSYTSGWCGADIIPDPPIHKSREAIARLRQQFRVVVYSARCYSEAGRQAIVDWLHLHEIEVDEVCQHKPPAIAYVDDRAIPFLGDWDQAISDVFKFRK